MPVTAPAVGGTPAASPAAAPAAPAAAPAAPAEDQGLFGSLAIEDPGAQPAPAMDPPMDQAEAAQPAAEPPPQEEPTPEPKPEEKPPEAAKPATLLAGRFKSPQELEIAYGESSKEGLRLHSLLKETDSQLADLKSQVATLKAQAEVPPPEPELTKDQLELMTPEERAAYGTRRELAKHQAVQAKKAAEDRLKQEAAGDQARHDKIIKTCEAMEKDSKKWPDFKALQPLMEELLAAAPELRGREYTPQMAYWAAFGYRALQAQTAASNAGQQAEEDARQKAAAAAAVAAAGSGGAAGAGGSPATPKGPAGDDEAFNDALIKAGQRRAFRIV